MAQAARKSTALKTKTIAPRRREPKAAPPPPAPAVVEAPVLPPVIIAPEEVQGLALELAALHVQMQEEGHDLIGLLRKTAKDAYGIDLPAREIEMMDDDEDDINADPAIEYAEALDVRDLENEVVALKADIADANKKLGAALNDLNALRTEVAKKADKAAPAPKP